MYSSCHIVSRLIVALAFCSSVAFAAVIKGKVIDSNKETLVGAHILIEGMREQGVAGLDGSFTFTKLTTGTYRITVSFIGYKNLTKEVTINKNEDIVSVEFILEPDLTQLGEIIVTAVAEGGSDAQARAIEKNSPNTLNIISAKAIALSPDITVANVVQRVSGLSIERNSNGDPQYAIIRGMPKRYNYTLVNGMKIPSPDNKNRYVPLDIFPASLLERLEVYKSLTPDLEADGIAGSINMVMKSAPEASEIRGDVQGGFNLFNYTNGFQQFNGQSVRYKTPRDFYGSQYQAQPRDFTKQNLETETINPFPDVIANLSVGDRLLKNRLGVMVGGSYQNSYRGSESVWYDAETDRFGSNNPSLLSMQNRQYSMNQKRIAGHLRADYRLAPEQTLSVYSGWFSLYSQEVREVKTTYVDGRNYNPGTGSAILQYSTRTHITDQKIFTNSLQGRNKLTPWMKTEWSLNYSIAEGNEPDNARFIRNGELINNVERAQNVERRNARQWEGVHDTDASIYYHFILAPAQWQNNHYIKLGGLYRDRDRVSTFNRYLFDPSPNLQIQGTHWNTYSDVTWSVVNPAGSMSDARNNESSENIIAAYVMGKTQLMKSLEVVGGVRMEDTQQGYVLMYPGQNQIPDTVQHYTDFLPSIGLKYRLRQGQNLRLNYFKALSRPGFFEIIPYRDEQEGLDEVGNPLLKRTLAHNIDLRWEKFSSSSDQIMIGVFYKQITDPIEYAVAVVGVNNERVIRPDNFGKAQNWGIEVDATRFFNKIGIRGNYTYTNSTLTTSKALNTRKDPSDPSSELTVTVVQQTRPMQGQADHIGNLSGIYKDIKKGFESQLSLVYVGERLEVISPEYDNDTYSKPVIQLDFSAEKKLGKNFEVFFKAINLLNSPYQTFIKRPVNASNQNVSEYPYQTNATHETMIRRDIYYQSFRVGVRFDFQ